jgi:diadenylate cyclase
MPDMFDNLTLLDLFDILTIAVLIYFFARLLKKDIAIRLLIVLLAICLAAHLSIFAGLTTTSLLLRSVVSSLAIILVIIFQNDIRRTFLSFGRRLTEQNNNHESSETIEELIKAVNDMASKNIGALIVIVRRMSIDHLLVVGTQIDAKLTSELLNSIFLPYSPIHDGAVIISDGKIMQAGCLLPLSKNPDISKSFGTRHRAALGLSELVDAMVVVVSEETGKISIVADSKIYYDVDTTEIRRMLKKALEIKHAAKPHSSGEA